MEAVRKLVSSRAQEERKLLTLEEFLAGVLLEESFVDDRTGKIVNHKFENWLNLLFSVSGIMRQGYVLFSVS